MSFFLGNEQETGTLVELPVVALHRHLMAIGASGSGKTVLCKCIIEEAIRNDIPAVIVDPQGDISSLALKGDPGELEKHGIPMSMQEEFFEKTREFYKSLKPLYFTSNYFIFSCFLNAPKKGLQM